MEKKMEICSKINQYSTSIGQLMQEDYKRGLDEDIANLTTKQGILLDMLNTHSRTIGEIAEVFSMTASAASQLISKLEKDGFVKRDINPANRREILVSLDQRGLESNRKVTELQEKLIMKYYGKLEIDDLEKLLDLHEKLFSIAKQFHKE